MHTKRRTRAAIGIGCLLVLSLSMGWFVGHYIPGSPQAPGSTLPPLDYVQLLEGSGYASEDIVNTQFGETAAFRSLTQGEAFLWETRQPITAGYYDENGIHHDIDETVYAESMKASEMWTYQCPSIDVTITDAKIVSAKSFVEWYPDYDEMSKNLDYSSMVLVTASITNESDTTLTSMQDFPSFTLWGDSVLCQANIMGAGISLDASALTHLADEARRVKKTEDSATDTYSLFDIKPGETHVITLPFLVSNYMLTNPEAFDELDLSKFCVQTPDYENATIYRLLLA